MSHICGRAVRLLAALALTLTLAGLAATPASASVTGQCDPSHTCMNQWNGCCDIKTYQGYAANNAMTIHWLGQGNGTFEIRTAGGGCVGDLNGAQGDARAGSGNNCPSQGAAGWGTVMQAITETSICGGYYLKYWDAHWKAYVGFPDGSGHQVYLNTTGTCLAQQAA